MATSFAANEVVQQAEELFHKGERASAAQLLSDAIGVAPSATLWNDWAAVQAAMGQFEDAERGFRAALQFDATSAQAMENLGALLFARGCYAQAAAFLRGVLSGATAEKRELVTRMLAKCAEAGASSKEPSLPSAGAPEPSLPAGTAAGAPAVWDADVPYEEWCTSVFRTRIPVPGVRVATSWPEDTEWGQRAFDALLLVECEYVAKLLTEIRDRQIEGDLVEFGIFRGWWVNFFHETTERLGLHRRIYGFDSFEGLSEPHPEHDQAFWKKGQYACSLEQVSRNVRAAARPRIKLVKGFFEKSLRGADAQVAGKFAYVRIDCDIYQPALDCLRYIGPRLADGAILVFDDWPHIRGYGEQRAFEEWLPSVPHLEFEFLFFGGIGHFYMRVHHKK